MNTKTSSIILLERERQRERENNWTPLNGFFFLFGNIKVITNFTK